MPDLRTQYMGLTLETPVIVGSSGLTWNIESLKEIEKRGAGAVVIKSLFEEEILEEAGALSKQDVTGYGQEAGDYLNAYVRQENIAKYLKHIREAKAAINIPVIASVNCVSGGEWVTFAKKIEDAGADALEVNIFLMPSDPRVKSEELERQYYEIAAAVTSTVKIPVALKVSFYLTSMTNFLTGLSGTDVSALVLFNRFHTPDIDVDKLDIVPASIFSQPKDYLLPLRWAGMVSGKLKCDLALTTGFHDGESVVKGLLAGAKAVQVVSCLYEHGLDYITELVKYIDGWMARQSFSTVDAFCGKLRREQAGDGVIYERSQFMKYFSSFKG